MENRLIYNDNSYKDGHVLGLFGGAMLGSLTKTKLSSELESLLIDKIKYYKGKLEICKQNTNIQKTLYSPENLEKCKDEVTKMHVEIEKHKQNIENAKTKIKEHPQKMKLYNEQLKKKEALKNRMDELDLLINKAMKAKEDNEKMTQLHQDAIDQKQMADNDLEEVVKQLTFANQRRTELYAQHSQNEKIRSTEREKLDSLVVRSVELQLKLVESTKIASTLQRVKSIRDAAKVDSPPPDSKILDFVRLQENK